MNLLQFHGFNNHGAYWDPDGDPPADGVFDEIVSVIFKADAVLAPASTT